MRRPLSLLLGFAAVLAGAASCSDDRSPDVASSPDVTAATAAPATTTAVPHTAATVHDGTNTWTSPDGTEVTFEAVVPPGRVAGQTGPVLVAFPPGGQDLDLTRQIVDSDWRTEALARCVVVVSPAAPSTGLWFTDASAALVSPFLDAVAASFPPPSGRFDLWGISNGGLSAFRAALEHPDRFRSMLLAPGAPPSDATDDQFAALAGLRIAQFVGGDDSSWLAASQASHDRFAHLGIDTSLVVVPGDDHFLASLDPVDEWDALALSCP